MKSEAGCRGVEKRGGFETRPYAEMPWLAVILLLAFVPALRAQTPGFDPYGGSLLQACPDQTHAYFTIQKIGARFWFCTPVITSPTSVNPANATSHAWYASSVANVVAANTGLTYCSPAGATEDTIKNHGNSHNASNQYFIAQDSPYWCNVNKYGMCGGPGQLPCSATSVSTGISATESGSQVSGSDPAVYAVTLSGFSALPSFLNAGGGSNITPIWVSGCSVVGYNGTWIPASSSTGSKTITFNIPASGLAAATGCQVSVMDPGTQYNWGKATVKRLASWGFNSIGVDSSSYVLGDSTCKWWQNSSPTFECTWPPAGGTANVPPIQMPYMVEIKPAQTTIYNGPIGSTYVLTEPVKDTQSGTNDYYLGYKGGAVIDVFDPKLATYLSSWLASTQSQAQQFRANDPWIYGIVMDDSDYFVGTGAGPDFPPSTGLSSTANIGYSVFLSSPLQTATDSTEATGGPFLYSHTLVDAKADATNPAHGTCGITHPCSLRDYLYDLYSGSISALNTAWSWSGCSTAGPGGTNVCPNYTAFDSSCTMVGAVGDYTCGTTLPAETIGTGDGTTQGFLYTVAHAPFSPNSVAVSVGGSYAVGDCPWYNSRGQVECKYLRDLPAYYGYGEITAGFRNQYSGPQTNYLTVPVGNVSISGNGTTATATVPGGLPAGLVVGWNVLISNCSNIGFNTAAAVVSINAGAGMFTFANATNASATGCTVDPNVVKYTSPAQVNLSFLNAPASGTAITMGYVYNGWASGGTGLMDEDGNSTASGGDGDMIKDGVHYSPLVGTAGYCLEGPNLNYPTYYNCGGAYGKAPAPTHCGGNLPCQYGIDLDNWVSQYSAQIFKTEHDLLKAVSSLPFAGLDTMGSSGAPAYSKILQGEAPYVDFVYAADPNWWRPLASPQPDLFQTVYQYQTEYSSVGGDSLPFVLWSGDNAQYDSSVNCFSTTYANNASQSARGQVWYNGINYMLTHAGHYSDYPLIGDTFWDWQDYQGLNQGVVSLYDNAYDGKQAVRAAGIDPATGLATGGEARDYGDFVSWMALKNGLWLGQLTGQTKAVSGGVVGQP
ncbi:MAG TPA: hypothetical protein VGZ29_01220 [Terriglobia bacterium]|nr:hypothetical protein [Terriglobia bacterium]